MKFIHLLSILVLLTSCESNSQTVTKYYNIKSFTEKLIEDLTRSKPEVNKKWKYNQETESQKTNNLDWQKELKLFLDSDINMSSFVTSYDSTVTSHKIVYKLKPSEKLPVKELSITFDSLNTPKTIATVKESENYFFKNKTYSTMHLIDGNLSQYSIGSVQKLLWFKSDSSLVEGEIVSF